MKFIITIAVCLLSSLAAAAIGAFHPDILDGYDVQVGGFEDIAGQAWLEPRRLDPSDWRANRTVFIGVGDYPEHIGHLVSDPSTNYTTLYRYIKEAADELCPENDEHGRSSGFNTCDGEKQFTVNRDHDFYQVNLVIQAKASYWPASHLDLRSALIEAVAATFQEVARINCYGLDETQWCASADKIFVRVDYIGWLLLVLRSDKKAPPFYVCGDQKMDTVLQNVASISSLKISAALDMSVEGLTQEMNCQIYTDKSVEWEGDGAD